MGIEMTVLESTALQAEKAANFLGHFLSTTNPDKLDWKPKAENCDSKTRSTMEIVAECISVNNGSAALLRGETPAEAQPPTTVEEARAALTSSAASFANALRSSDDSVFQRKFQMPWGEVTGEFLIDITIANMHYHNGQLNYIQCLYGDDVFHAPRG